MSILAWIIFGAIAGWIAHLITGRGGGLFSNIIVGIVGSFLGGFLFGLFGGGDVTGFNLSSFIVAVIGSIVLLVVLGFIKK